MCKADATGSAYVISIGVTCLCHSARLRNRRRTMCQTTGCRRGSFVPLCVIMALFVYVVTRVRVVGLRRFEYIDWTGRCDRQPATILLLHTHVNCQHHENTGHVISLRQPLYSTITYSYPNYSTEFSHHPDGRLRHRLPEHATVTLLSLYCFTH